MYLGFGASPFRDITKRIRETFYVPEDLLDYLLPYKKAHGIIRERLAFLAGSTMKSVQFFGYSKEKQKRFISICYLINCLLFFIFVLGSPSFWWKGDELFEGKGSE